MTTIGITGYFAASTFENNTVENVALIKNLLLRYNRFEKIGYNGVDVFARIRLWKRMTLICRW